ncbi:MAG: flagellar basal body rod C-terminal domain-containing protein [Novosphingobium sp.]
MVSGGTGSTLAMNTASDGSISFTLDGTAATVDSGALAGTRQALTALADTNGKLDTLAANIVSVVNSAQANGVDLKGNTGAAIFSGTGAADMAVIASSGSEIAAAATGSASGSRDGTNLTAMRNAISAADPAGDMNSVLFDISSAVAGRTITRDALDSIASSAKVALQAQAGVDLDQEAVHLVRYQQAFQASGRVMQVASDIFNSILAIK